MEEEEEEVGESTREWILCLVCGHAAVDTDFVERDLPVCMAIK